MTEAQLEDASVQLGASASGQNGTVDVKLPMAAATPRAVAALQLLAPGVYPLQLQWPHGQSAQLLSWVNFNDCLEV